MLVVRFGTIVRENALLQSERIRVPPTSTTSFGHCPLRKEVTVGRSNRKAGPSSSRALLNVSDRIEGNPVQLVCSTRKTCAPARIQTHSLGATKGAPSSTPGSIRKRVGPTNGFASTSNLRQPVSRDSKVEFRPANPNIFPQPPAARRLRLAAQICLDTRYDCADMRHHPGRRRSPHNRHRLTRSR